MSATDREQAASRLAGLGGSSYELTLITGDRVRLSTGPNGQSAVTVDGADPLDSLLQVVKTPEGDVYAYPASALPRLADDTLDRELFNLTKLVDYGYHDGIPVIVTYESAAPRTSAGSHPPGLTTTATLSSAGALAATVDPNGRWWDAVQVEKSRAAGGPLVGVEKIWLDELMEVALDESVPQIGAPRAWTVGFDGRGVKVAVLDTGVDADHPDVAGKVVASKSFIPDLEVADGHGHGTHVAATVAGTGAASDGQRSGVAPRADLVVGKVCDNGGSCPNSTVIAGMEWATLQQGVDVVNVSLGGSATDGTDPVSQAVNQLTEQTGALFVIAAGNSGSYVGFPGAADAALTVGAVNKNDQLASFSGRGPRLADYAIKPEITAPGVGIVAARAAGTSMGAPVDDFYTAANGTSMATPHVAGAAAILLQQHPDWTGQQVKDALMTTAAAVSDYTVYMQGTGRVDVGHAITQDVYATGKADFGLQSWPQDELPLQTRTVTYTNTGAEDVTLALDLALTGDAPVADGVISLSADEVDVPPGGDASVTITLDPKVGNPGTYGGYLAANDGEAISLRTAVGFTKDPPLYNIVVSLKDRRGQVPYSMLVNAINLDGPGSFSAFGGTGTPNDEAVIRVPPGHYALNGGIPTRDASGWLLSWEAFDLFSFDVHVRDGDVAVSVDARDARDISATVADEQRPLEGLRHHRALDRERVDGSRFQISQGHGSEYWRMRQGWIPGAPPTKGELYLANKITLRQPLIRAEIQRPAQGHARSALDALTALGSARFDGTLRLPLVYAGAGRPEDYEGIDAVGKVVLVKPVDSPVGLGLDVGGRVTAEAQAAAAAGAAALVVTRGPDVVLQGSTADDVLPVLVTPYQEGQRLLALLQSKPVMLELTGVEAEYVYDLRYDEHNTIPTDLVYTTDRSSLAKLTIDFHSDTPNRLGSEGRLSNGGPGQVGHHLLLQPLLQPSQRVEFVTADPGIRYQHIVRSSTDSRRRIELDEKHTSYTPRQRINETWFKQPLRPTLRREPELWCFACRVDGSVRLQLHPHGDAHSGHSGSGGLFDLTTSTRFWRNGAPVGLDDLTVPEPADYRIEYDVRRGGSDVLMSNDTRTAWSFRSAQPTQIEETPGCLTVVAPETQGCALLPLIFPRYDLPLDLLNRAPAGRAVTLTVHTDRPAGYKGSSVAWLKLEVSFDRGQNWQRPKRVKFRGGEAFEVTVEHPKLSKTVGTVSLHAEAWDDAGNRVEQTVLDAYGLKDHGRGGHKAKQLAATGSTP